MKTHRSQFWTRRTKAKYEFSVSLWVSFLSFFFFFFDAVGMEKLYLSLTLHIINVDATVP